jgi:hypothetical protein
MTTCPTVLDNLDSSQRKVQIIVYDQQSVRCQVIVMKAVPDRFTAFVHESQGAKKNDFLAPKVNRGMF